MSSISWFRNCNGAGDSVPNIAAIPLWKICSTEDATMKMKMHLAFDLSYTHLDGRWRTPGSWMHRLYPDVSLFEDLARIAERGCIDMLFFGDGTGIPSTWEESEEVAVRWGIQWPRQDMSPFIAAMSRV